MKRMDANPARTGSPEAFPTTLWSEIGRAGDPSRTASNGALAGFCLQYWHPIYAYIRRTGAGPHEAEDLAQAFFEHLLETEALGRVRREGGRFRSWLLGVLKNFLNGERAKARAQKRGGGRQVLSLEAQESEVRYALEPKEIDSPDRQFERNWAISLLEKVLGQVEAEYAKAGKAEQYREIQPFLSGSDRTAPYAEAARRLGASEGNVKVQVHRLRQRFGELLRAAVAEAVEDPSQVDQEIRALIELAAPKL